MKKFLAVLFVLASLPMTAADLELVVNASSPGYQNAKTIDVSTVGTGEEIILELWLRNIDFTLAGFEGELQFPTWLSLIDTNTPGTSYQTGLAATQQLPADAAGSSTATTFRNSEGYARVGGVITDPAQRPTSGDELLATVRLKLGRDFDSGLSARDLATCTSASEVIRFLACNTGAANCHIIADESANAVSVNYTQADLTIALNDSSTTVIKGDANNSGTLTTQDVATCLQCIIYGDNNTNANCPLDMGDTDSWLRHLDVNCSGAATNQDIGPLVRRAVGLNNRPSTKNLSFNAVAGEGNLALAGGDSAAYVVGVTLQAQGKVTFGMPKLSQEGIQDGWQVAAKQIADSNTYNYVLFRMDNGDKPVPSLELPYTAEGDAKVAVASVETIALSGDNRHMPSLNRMDLRNQQ